MSNLIPLGAVTYFEDDAAMPNAIAEIEVAAVKEKGQPWGVFIMAWEDYAGPLELAKLFAKALMIAALQAEMLNAGHSVEDALELVETITKRTNS